METEDFTCHTCHATMAEVDPKGQDNYCADCSFDASGELGKLTELVCLACCQCSTDDKIDATLADLHMVGAIDLLNAIAEPPLSLDIPESCWVATGDDPDHESVLTTSVDILAQTHHLWAIAIHHDDDTVCPCITPEDIRDGAVPPMGVQHAAQANHEEWFQKLGEAFTQTAPYGSVRVKGRDYLLFMEPYER